MLKGYEKVINLVKVVAFLGELQAQEDSRSMRCIHTIARRSWVSELAGMVNGTMPYLIRAKN